MLLQQANSSEDDFLALGLMNSVCCLCPSIMESMVWILETYL